MKPEETIGGPRYGFTSILVTSGIMLIGVGILGALAAETPALLLFSAAGAGFLVWGLRR